MSKNLVVVLALLCIQASCAQKLMIIMLDGFRWDYIDNLTDEEIPNFKSFVAGGVRAEYVQPPFPSVSWPGWTTISTGLFPENHGIVGNTIYNRDTGLTFGVTVEENRDPSWWNQHVPIWTSATEQGLRVSMYAWMYCDIPYSNGIVPEKCLPYDIYEPQTNDVEWFGDQLGNAAIDLATGYDLAMVYYNYIDNLGHQVGPSGPALYDGIIAVDAKLGDLFDTMDALATRDETNIIILSDHGMVGDLPTRWERLTDYIDGNVIDKSVAPGIHTMISLKDLADADQVVANLSTWEGVEAYKREDIPEHFHYKESDYSLDVLAVASLGHQIADDEAFAESFVPTAGPNADDNVRSTPEMGGIFFANGPAFKVGYTNQWIKMVDEYQIFVQLLGIQGEPHEGTYQRVAEMYAA